jgi:glutaminyl-peptide cyclotransferase
MSPTDLSATPSRKSKNRLWLAIGGMLVLAGVAVFVWPGLRTSMADSRSSLSPAKIDGDRAFGYLKAICALGPRPAGSEANTRQREMVAKHFRKFGATVTEQPFTGVDPLSGRQVPMVNLIGSWFPERLERVVIGVHYDTRPFPDEDPDPANLRIPFIGANDGASGVAMLMEIAHHLADSATPWGVDLVLFDGEELVYGGGQSQNGEYFLGSKAFARAYDKSQRNRTKATPHYEAGIVLDMVAGKNMVIGREPHSLDFAPKLVRDVWSIAKALKIHQFREGIGRAVLDDHLPLNNAGIPAIDIIDFEYPAWHTSKDLPENCSASSLKAVGLVVTAWLNKPKARR